MTPGFTDEVICRQPVLHQVGRLLVSNSHVAIVEHAREEIVNFLCNIHYVANPTPKHCHSQLINGVMLREHGGALLH